MFGFGEDIQEQSKIDWNLDDIKRKAALGNAFLGNGMQLTNNNRGGFWGALGGVSQGLAGMYNQSRAAEDMQGYKKQEESKTQTANQQFMQALGGASGGGEAGSKMGEGGTFKFNETTEDAIAKAAQKHGVSVEQMRTIAQIESGGRATAQNPNSSAGGLFQFIDGTAKQYGLSNKLDPYQNADAGARLLKDNAVGLRNALGREPTGHELYLAHQQGLGGATKILSNPNANAASVLGSQQVGLNGGNGNMTLGQFANIWKNKYGRYNGSLLPKNTQVGGL